MIWHDLTDEQLEAARMSASGMRNVDIARKLGRNPSTVSKWKKVPAYAETVRLLHRAANSQAVEDARLARTELMRDANRLARAIVVTSVRTLNDDEDGLVSIPAGTEIVLDTAKAAMALNSLHSWYKTLSAQTGLTETTKTEIGVGSDELDALDGLLERLERSG